MSQEKIEEQVREWNGVKTLDPCLKGCKPGDWKDLGNGKKEQRCLVCNRLISTATMEEK